MVDEAAEAQADSGLVAELRSAGQPGTAVPTFPVPQHVVESTSPPSREEREKDGAPSSGESALRRRSRSDAQAETRVPGNLVVNLAIEDIDKNPFQTRYVEDDDSLEELADSIKVNGVVQPIVVRPAEEEGRYI